MRWKIILPAALVALPLHAAGELEEVIVTAQKREESLLSVPISMTVVQAAAIEKLSVDNFDDMQLYVPNFTVTNTPANSYVFVRGIGTQGNVLAFESSVALFVDGIYGGRNRQFQDPFLDLERVEVLRGPQGALFGRNTSAGAVSVTTAKPTREFSASAQGEYETEFGSWASSGHVSGPVSENVQVRFAGRYADTAGYIRNTTLGRDEPAREDVSARLSAAWQPTETIDVVAKLEYAEAEVVGTPFELVFGGGDPVFTKTANDAFAPERDDADSLNAMIRSDFRLGEHTLTAIAGSSQFEYSNAINIQALGPAHLVVENAEDFDQQSLELRLLSPTGGALEYIFGAYADDGESVIRSQSTTDLPFTPMYPESVTTRRYTETNDSYAAFGQMTWNISDAWRLTGGLRYTHVDKEAQLRRSFVGIAPGAQNTPLDVDRSEDFVDPSANLQWNFSDDWMLFATYAQGSKSGGFNGPTSTDTGATYEYEDEASESYEVGIKGRFPSGYLSVVVFQTEYTGLQKSVLDIQNATYKTGNAAEAESKGVELEAAWTPFDLLRFNASLAYLDAAYTSYPGAPCPFGTPGFGTTAACDVAGYPLTNAPEWSGSLAANVNAALSEALRFEGSLTATYRDDIYYQPSYNPLERQEAFWKLDLRVGLTTQDERWSAALLVRNLLDEESSSLIFETFPFFINPAVDRVHLPDRPRTYTVQVRYRFD